MSRGLGDVYKRQIEAGPVPTEKQADEMILGRETDFPPTPLVRPEDQ